jgi:hypothetical protein
MQEEVRGERGGEARGGARGTDGLRSGSRPARAIREGMEGGQLSISLRH